VAVAAGAVVLVALNLRMAVTSVPPILPDLGLSPLGGSLLTTLPVVLFGVGAAAAPAVRARLGEERSLFAALGLLLAGVVARGLWPESALFPGTVLACAGIAVLNVLLPGFVRRRFPDRVGLMMGLYTTALIAGATLASGLTVPVRDAAGGSNGIALGAWALPLGFAALAWLPVLREAHGPPSGEARAGISLRRSPLAWQVTLFMGLQSLLYFAPLSWLPTIYREEGISAATAGVLLSLFNAVGMVSALAAPVLAGRMRDQRGSVAATVCLTAAGVLTLLVAPRSGALVAAVLLGLGQGAALSLALLMIVLRAGDDHTAARLSGMAQGAGYVIAGAGPLGVGLLHALSGGWTVPLLALLAVVGVELAVGLAAGRQRVIARTASES
jgi:CP family cyanate transporter-like MFS transporter